MNGKKKKIGVGLRFELRSGEQPKTLKKFERVDNGAILLGHLMCVWNSFIIMRES